MTFIQRSKAFIKEKITHIFFPPGTTPLPASFCLVIYFTLICNAMNLTTVFSYLPKMTKSFGVSEEDVGKNAGIIASSLFVGRIFASYFWGLAADLFGKKKIMLTSIICLSVTALAFGFSINIYMATAFRFLQGISSGVIVLAKVVVLEKCDDTNQAFGMTLVTTSWSLGMMIGPSFAGLLVFPAERWPDIIAVDSLLGKFPVLLPNIILSLLLLISAVAVFLLLPKDKTSKKSPEKDILHQSAQNDLSYGTTISEWQKVSGIQKDEYSKLVIEPSWRRCRYHSGLEASLDTDMVIDVHYIQLIPSKTHQKETVDKTLSYDDNQPSLKRTWKLIKDLLKNKDTLGSSVLYLLVGFTSIGFNEILPVWFATDPQYHGLGFSPVTIGVFLLVCSCVLLVLQQLFILRLVNKLLSKKTLVACQLIFAVCVPLVSCTEPLTRITNKYVFWSVAPPIFIIARFSTSAAFTAVNVFLANSVNDDLIGSANGLGMSFSALGRALAPLVFGGVYSWSMTNVKNVYPDGLGFPFNQYLTFFFISFMSILSAIAASFFPDRLNYTKQKQLEMEMEQEESHASVI